MSNHHAIATVTATLVHMLRDSVKSDVNGSEVWADRPSADVSDSEPPEVRVFLFGAHPNASWRNNDLPTRRSGGSLAERPQVALDLHYLFTFHGNERALEPQRLIGSVVRELHTRPILTRAAIRQMVEDEVAADALFPLATTDLADQEELVRFTPMGLDLDEMSKLWSVFFQTPYRLSTAFQASIVLINPGEAGRPALPVQERRIFATTIRRPRIERVVASAGPLQPITVGTEVVIRGSQLRGDETSVWFGSERVDPSAGALGDREIAVTVPAAARAGMVGVRVEHRVLLGEPPATRRAGESNVAPMILRPRIHHDGNDYLVSIADVTADGARHRGNLEVEIEPAVHKRQRVHAVLNLLGPVDDEAPSAFSFADEARDQEGQPDRTSSLVIPFRDVPAGAYLVRIQVDGAESPLERDADNESSTFEQYVAPQVGIP